MKPSSNESASLPTDSIIVPPDGRKDLGNLSVLVASIERVGLLHPIVVNSRHELVAGRRRLAAVKRMGWKTVPATVAKSLDDAVKALQAERDENICRESFPAAEMVALGKRLEKLEREAAKERQRKHGETAPGKSKNTAGNLPEVFGDTRDKVAAVLGVSGKTYEKAKAVVDAAAEDPEKFGDLPAVADARSVSAAHDELKRRREPAGGADASRDEIAQLVGVPRRMIDLANKVLSRGAPELVKAVESGRLDLDLATDIAEKPLEEQAGLVAAVLDVGAPVPNGDLLTRVRGFADKLKRRKGAMQKLNGRDAILVVASELTALLADVQCALGGAPAPTAELYQNVQPIIDQLEHWGKRSRYEQAPGELRKLATQLQRVFELK